MINVPDGACSDQFQLFVEHNADILPILTWGFERSKTVASPRIPLASFQKTCCTGLTPLCCRRASRLVRNIGANDRVTTTILLTPARTPEHDEERIR